MAVTADPSPSGPSAGADDPVLVEVTRGPLPESRHRGIAAIVDASGKVLSRWGDHERPIYPRSAIKSLQAIALVESGAADAFGVSDEELALACASHGGEPAHTEHVGAWLSRIGCTVDDLECGAQVPSYAPAAEALVRAGAMQPTQLHNNCSGKHTGFLATARHLGEPTRDYRLFTHPVQQRILGILEQMTGQELGDAPWGLDGCSIPTIAVPVGALAMAMARHGRPEGPARTPHRRGRCASAGPGAGSLSIVAGTGRFDTVVMEATGGKALMKTGAEGVYCACLPELGLGIALKIEDGAGRASEVAIAALLDHVGALDDRARSTLAEQHPPAGPIPPGIRGRRDPALPPAFRNDRPGPRPIRGLSLPGPPPPRRGESG